MIGVSEIELLFGNKTKLLVLIQKSFLTEPNHLRNIEAYACEKLGNSSSQLVQLEASEPSTVYVP